MRFFAVVSALSLVACAPSPQPPAPESARIVIRLLLPMDQAYYRTANAFLAEGLNIGYASPGGGELATAPLPIGAVKSRVSEPIMEPYSRKIIYHARVLVQGDTATVILSGGVRAEMFGAVAPPEAPLHSQMTGTLHDAWHRIERVAARLRGEEPQ
jgi:hypothetical protein